MTTDMMNLWALPENNSDTDLLRGMIAFAAQRLMELEVEGLTGATHGERSKLAMEYMLNCCHRTAMRYY